MTCAAAAWARAAFLPSFGQPFGLRTAAAFEWRSATEGTEYGARGAFFGLLRVVPRVQAVAKREPQRFGKMQRRARVSWRPVGMSPSVGLFRLGWTWLGEVIEHGERC